MRKYLSLALAMLVMAITMVPAFAATITVTNPVAENSPYSVYKIFDASPIANTDPQTYQYTISEDSQWFSVLTGTDKASKIAGVTIHPAEGSGKTHVVTFDKDANAEDTVEALVSVLRTATEGKTPDAQITLAEGASTASTTVTGSGYYFVKTSTGALCNLFTATDSIDILDKNDFKFDKSLDYPENELHRDFAIGETVKFKIIGLVPVTLSYDAYTYIITDTMPSQIDLVPNSIKVKVGTVDMPADMHAVTADARKFTLKVDAKALNDAGHAMKDITVTYNGIVNETAKYGIYENLATLDFGPHPETDADKLVHKEDKENIFNHEILIDKYDAETNKKLENAKFALAKEENGKVLFYKYDTAAKAVNWVEAPGVTTAKEAMEQKKAQTLGDAITMPVTDANGSAKFFGLRVGSYFLIEVSAPAGYNALLEPIAVNCSATGAASDTYQVISQVANIGGSTLPTTGGTGTVIFYVAGVGLVIGAILFLAAKKKASGK